MLGAVCGGWEVGGSSLVQVDAHLQYAQEERQEQHGWRQKKPEKKVDSGDSTKSNNYGDVSQVYLKN